MASFLKKLSVLIIIVLVAAFLFVYFATYSSGTRAGVIMKISNSGVLFKTWEGQLDMGTFGAVKSENFASQTFEFSIDGSNHELLEKLKQAQLTGQRVALEYDQKYFIFPWRGGTKYIAVDVEYRDMDEAPQKKKEELPFNKNQGQSGE